MVEMMQNTVAQLRESLAPWRAAGARRLHGLDVADLGCFPEERPAFVLGAARSGTSAMLRGLRDGGGGFFAWDEGHLLGALPALFGSIRSAWDQRAATIPRPPGAFAVDHLDLARLLRGVVQTFHDTYADAARRAGRPRWADKTPSAEAVAAAPLLAQLYPRGRFIFMHRHPLKVFLSRMRKFPNFRVAAGAINYALIGRLWWEAKSVLPAEQFIELAQADLSLRPDVVAATLARALDLDDRQASAMADYFRTARPESTGSSDDAAEVFLEDLDWPADDQQFVREVCAEPAAAWGYSLSRDGDGRALRT